MNSKNWFYKLTGISESEWDYTMESLPNKIDIKDCGEFNTYNIYELQKMIARQLNNNSDKKINNNKIKIYTRKNYDNDKLFDTSSLQFHGESNTLYQVASNFNCHEVSSEIANVFSGLYLTKLMRDLTQGPSAAAGAGHGSILRLTQHKKKPINLLEDTALKVNNGKLYNSNQTVIDDNLIKIGLHSNVRACFLRSLQFEYNPNGPIIDQVYTSTCICSRRDKDFKLPQILLTKAYEGTYMCGIYKKSKRIVLTLIGGGCFNNPLDLIIQIIATMHKKYSKYLREDCEVILPIFDPNPREILNYINKYMGDICEIIEQ